MFRGSLLYIQASNMYMLISYISTIMPLAKYTYPMQVTHIQSMKAYNDIFYEFDLMHISDTAKLQSYINDCQKVE